MSDFGDLNQILVCGLCQNNLLPSESKSLNCLHSFCNDCFEKTFSAEEEDFGSDANLSCPVCHSNYAQMAGDAETTHSLQLNTFIQKVLVARQIQESGRICELCANEDTCKASAFWCHDCLKFLCENCQSWHQRLRPHDHVINLSNGECEKLENFISPSKCLNHEKRFKMYCPQCCVCMCSYCLLEHCSGEKACSCAVSVDDVAPETRLECQSILVTISQLVENMKQHNEELTDRIKKRLQQNSDHKEEISLHTEEIIQRLRDNTNALVADMEAQTAKEIESIQEKIRLKDNSFKQLEILKNNIQQLVNLADNVDLLLHFPKLRSRWKTLEKLHLDGNDSESQVIIKYNTWYIKTYQMLKEFSVGCCRLENVRDESSRSTSLGESLLAKVTDDFICQHPPLKPRLIDTGRQLVDKMERMITSVYVTEDNHVLVSDFFGRDLREYDKEQQLLYSFKPDGMESPLDMCPFSASIMGVVAGSHDLFLMERNAGESSMTLLKHIRTEKKYTSLCNCFGNILALDKFSNVDLLSSDGTVLRSILNNPKKWSCNHRISCGPTAGTFLLLDFVAEKVYCYNLEGKLLFSFDTEPGKETSDVCSDNTGNIYVCSRQDLYLVVASSLQKHRLLDFKKKLTQWPRMFIKNQTLFISFFTEEKNSVKIFSIH